MSPGHRVLLGLVLAAPLAACVSFSPEVKATFEPAHPGEVSHFEPRHVAFTPIVLPAAPADAGPHEDRGALVMEDVPTAPSPAAVGPVSGPASPARAPEVTSTPRDAKTVDAKAGDAKTGDTKSGGPQ